MLTRKELNNNNVGSPVARNPSTQTIEIGAAMPENGQEDAEHVLELKDDDNCAQQSNEKSNIRDAMTEMLDDSIRLLEEAITLVSSSSSKKTRIVVETTQVENLLANSEPATTVDQSPTDEEHAQDHDDKKRSRIAEKYREGINAIRSRFLGQDS
jgi:hypothetical protein